VNALRRGEIHYTYAGVAGRRGRSGTRPVLIVSSDLFNREPMPTVMVMPLTTSDWQSPLHVAIQPPDGGVLEPSFAMCDYLLPLRREMLIKPMGQVSADTLAVIDDRLKEILDL